MEEICHISEISQIYLQTSKSGHRISLRSEQMRLCCVLMCHIFVLPYIANFYVPLGIFCKPSFECLRGKCGEK